jgi:dGTPase
MGAFVKYPFSSEMNASLMTAGRFPKKKFGFFAQDTNHFNMVFEKLGLKRRPDGTYQRHPLAYLVEAADDICYHATDIEDGVRSGII